MANDNKDHIADTSKKVKDTVIESWEERFDKKFTDNPVFWSELVAEWHQGDIDVKPFKHFFATELEKVRKETALEEREALKMELLSKSISRKGLSTADIKEIFEKYTSEDLKSQGV